jgi:formaldehyde-activating enzyme involved in methanogenesis
MTGIGTDTLRLRAAEPAFLAALLRFLEGHEPDLLAVAEELGVPPDDLVWARHEIEQGAK